MSLYKIGMRCKGEVVRRQREGQSRRQRRTEMSYAARMYSLQSFLVRLCFRLSPAIPLLVLYLLLVGAFVT